MSDWQCANDSGNSVKIDPPPVDVRIAQGTKSFAKGEAEAILAKGGPTDVFVWSHLHGIHHDRYGESHYTVSVAVTDESNYPYFISPPLTTTVKGVPDKSERHRHCYAAFSPQTDDLKMAITSNKTLKVLVKGSRERDDWKWLTQEFNEIFSDISEVDVMKYIKGEISPEDLLKILQNAVHV